MVTKKQTKFCLSRTIKVGGVYLLPHGFEVRQQPKYLAESYYMDTNPFTKSLDGSPIVITEEKDSFYGFRFVDASQVFYITKFDMEDRDNFSSLFLVCTLYPLFHLWNYIIK